MKPSDVMILVTLGMRRAASLLFSGTAIVILAVAAVDDVPPDIHVAKATSLRSA